MKQLRFIALYASFCIVSMVANIGAQALASRAYRGQFALLAAMVVGTGVGLCVKYLLDRNWIFRHKSDSTAHEARTATMYTAMGLVTTLVFWLIEWGFDHVLGDAYRYVGAAVGLTIGYTVKYFLDRRFVFNTEGHRPLIQP
ncbi:GtrA family protein [Luteibacter aegosomatis]|uniref:GtrA family protein n=1 Tax=Luteibacter aegosomatis TaxID=2911537 RepID=UPI001FF8CE39|nr:GtrA family protein [Luteibacter aegosomatis]UPG86535.1 GtrA family protein [Luteibacter aegosomatis]